ncbi:MAG: hypothetical protein WB689_35770 [Xanthobacteraceae bacterium]
MQDETMEEFRDRIVRYHGGDFDTAFQNLKNDFVKASPTTRIGWLQGWDNALAMETKVTKEHAEFITKRRELEDLHRLLERGGR